MGPAFAGTTSDFDCPFAYFTASLGRGFPRTIRSLTRSFARHPALLTRVTMMTVQREGFFDDISTIRRGCCGRRLADTRRFARLCSHRDSMVARDDRPPQ